MDVEVLEQTCFSFFFFKLYSFKKPSNKVSDMTKKTCFLFPLSVETHVIGQSYPFRSYYEGGRVQKDFHINSNNIHYICIHNTPSETSLHMPTLYKISILYYVSLNWVDPPPHTHSHTHNREAFRAQHINIFRFWFYLWKANTQMKYVLGIYNTFFHSRVQVTSIKGVWAPLFDTHA